MISRRENIKQVIIQEEALNAMMKRKRYSLYLEDIEDRRTAKKAYNVLKEKKLAKQIYVTNIHNTRRR